MRNLLKALTLASIVGIGASCGEDEGSSLADLSNVEQQAIIRFLESESAAGLSEAERYSLLQFVTISLATSSEDEMVRD